jgi:hypothetical protein
MGIQNAQKEIYPKVGFAIWTCNLHGPKEGWDVPNHPGLQTHQQVHGKGYNATAKHLRCCQKPGRQGPVFKI